MPSQVVELVDSKYLRDTEAFKRFVYLPGVMNILNGKVCTIISTASWFTIETTSALLKAAH